VQLCPSAASSPAAQFLLYVSSQLLLLLVLAGYAAVANQCSESCIHLSPATLVIVPNTMLVPHWRQQIQASGCAEHCRESCVLLLLLSCALR